MRGIAFWFFASSILYILAGMALGMHMSAAHEYTLAPAHAHLNLVGFVMMAIFGLFYHLVPQAGAGLLPRIHFALATLGLWLMVPGIVLVLKGGTDAFAALGSILTVAATLLFLWILLRSRRVPAAA
ncbi:hypothetical protein [Polymorphum gilvum]|uniref:Conserved hypothetical signal peptide protein n=1 Tax=Polymorphum gilvum (strain LMG 25793 / CGMCC 1.9160 / SL003B-26A1) TaxID=991905 RepID=F2J6X2_POLGS|nr:hypothetical protein [Polymorphum gilvum]ADZ72605.1 Conserved hypothetical signal peptide protein [Polymorphum gilvum SL003B-26A1]